MEMEAGSRPQKKFMVNSISEFVLHLTWRKVGRRVTPRPALNRYNIEPTSESSCAMIEPVHPSPIRTTSFFGSLLGHLSASAFLGVQSTLPVMLTGPSGKHSLWPPTQSR